MQTEIENKDGHHHAMVKIVINGKTYETHHGLNPVASLKELAGVPLDQVLFEIKDCRELRLEDEARIEIHGGETFVSQEKQHHQVQIKINGVERKTHRGENSVSHLRKLGEVPADEILSEFKGGRFVDLSDAAHVDICGGEIFASHKPSGGSS